MAITVAPDRGTTFQQQDNHTELPDHTQAGPLPSASKNKIKTSTTEMVLPCREAEENDALEKVSIQSREATPKIVVGPSPPKHSANNLQSSASRPEDYNNTVTVQQQHELTSQRDLSHYKEFYYAPDNLEVRGEQYIDRHGIQFIDAEGNVYGYFKKSNSFGYEKGWYKYHLTGTVHWRKDGAQWLDRRMTERALQDDKELFIECVSVPSNQLLLDIWGFSEEFKLDIYKRADSDGEPRTIINPELSLEQQNFITAFILSDEFDDFPLYIDDLKKIGIDWFNITMQEKIEAVNYLWSDDCDVLDEK